MLDELVDMISQETVCADSPNLQGSRNMALFWIILHMGNIGINTHAR